MKSKTPDLDARGYPKVIAAGYEEGLHRGGAVAAYVRLDVPDDIHRQFDQIARDHNTTSNKILRQLYYEACNEMGIDTMNHQEHNLAVASWRKRHAQVKMHISEVVIDECDLPGQCENVEIGMLDPYYTTWDLKAIPEERSSRKLVQLNYHIRDATRAIEKLTSMKGYTSVFNEGRISKEEAKEELEKILDIMPDEIGETLWGWCSLDDVIRLIQRWKNSIILRMHQQLEVEKMRLSRAKRLSFEAKVDSTLAKRKKRMIATYANQKEVRPAPQPGEWPSWAGEMESYLDHASSDSQTNLSKLYLQKIRARDITISSAGSITEVQSDCTVDISKGLRHGNN